MPFFQAPLSGYSDKPMRILARQFSSPLVFTGVMLDKTALHPAAIKKNIFNPDDNEHPVGAQILGNDPKTMAKSAAVFEKIGYDLIDLNFACPVPKVLRRRRGGFLLTKPYIVMEIYKAVRDAVSCPVLMKLRTGFDSSDAAKEDFRQICTEAAEQGVDALVIHGRDVVKNYRGKADWGIIAEVKRRFPQTKIFGSGDIFDAESALQRLTTCKVDGVIIARGAIGNPWIFKEVRALFEGKPKPAKPTLTEQGQVILRHFEMIASSHEITKAVRYFRKFSVAYCRRHPQRKKVQTALMAAVSKEEVLKAIKKWYGVG